jgi:hypothetical protein
MLGVANAKAFHFGATATEVVPADIKDEWIVLEENDPPPDLARENAAFECERPRLVRDHLGKIALVRFDEVVDVFQNLNQAIIEGHRRFGWGRMLFREITKRDEPEYIANVDINHPCV